MLKEKTILVTGGAGSIGSGIIKRLLKEDVKKIISLDNNEIDQFVMKQSLDNERFKFYTADIRNKHSLDNVFASEKIDIIYHAAAMKHVVTCEDTPGEAVSTNVYGTQNIVDAAVKYGVSKTILISTDKAAYPMNVMGATKFVAERIVLNGNARTNGKQIFSCVRFGNVANTRGSVIPIFVHNMLEGKQLTVTDMKVTRFLMRIDDTINLIVRATEQATGGEIFILKMKAFRLADLVEVMKNRIAPRIKIDPEKIEIIETGLVSGEKLHEDLVNDLESNSIHDSGDMFVVNTAERSTTNAPRYISKDVEMLSHEELEKIILEYIRDKHYRME